MTRHTTKVENRLRFYAQTIRRPNPAEVRRRINNSTVKEQMKYMCLCPDLQYEEHTKQINQLDIHPELS